MNWDGKVRWHTPCPWPHEKVTIMRDRSFLGGHVTSDKRICYGSEHVYLLGSSEPNYPVPALVAPVQLSGNVYDRHWQACHQAANYFSQVRFDGGVNWDWYSFLNASDAEGFATWCAHNGFETRGVYIPWERGVGYSVRFR